MHGRRAPQLESCLLASHQKGFAGPRRPLLLPDGCVLVEPVAAHCPTEPAPGPGALGVWSRTVSVEAPLRMGRMRVGTSPGCSLQRGRTRASGPPQTAACGAGTHGWRPPRTHARSAWRARARSRPSGPRGSPAVRGACRPLGHSSSHVVRLVGVRRISLVTCGGGPFPGWGSLRNESPAPGLLGWQPNPRHDTGQMSRAAVCSTPVVTARRREHGNKPGAVGGGPGPWRRCGHVGSSAGWQRTDTCRSGISRSWAWSPR